MATEAGIVRKSAILLAKAETTAGTDPSPTVGSDGVVAYDVTVNPLGNAEAYQRAPIAGDSFLARQTTVAGKRHATATFTIPLAGTGDTTSQAAMTPEWSPIIQACGFTETYAGGGPSLTYEDSAVTATCTIYLYMGPAQTSVTNDWILLEMNGCAGNVVFNGTNGEPVLMEFEMSGTYVEPVDAADPGDPTLIEIIPEPLLSSGLAFNFGSVYSPVSNGFSLDMGQSVTVREDMNQASGYRSSIIVDRDPRFTCQIETDLVANFNPWNVYSANTAGTVSIGSLGSTAGNIVDIDLNRVSIMNAPSADRDGVDALDLEMQVARDVSSLSTAAVSMVIT